MDHPTDGELVAHARRFFRAADQMTPQKTDLTRKNLSTEG
jgi:hypothetical protein